MTPETYKIAKEHLRSSPAKWLVTGAAGFIGSHLTEKLLGLGQRVVGLDNFATGTRANLDHIRSVLTAEQWSRFEFLEGDICNLNTCQQATQVDYVLHHAALGSVPASLKDPLATHRVNVTGFLNILTAARDREVRRLVYASSSAVYGDDTAAAKVEERIGNLLSPYAVSKYLNELYASNFHRCYGMESVGLRYFNVFGARQDPYGPYAAVIPKWVDAMLRGDEVFINGDGETTRDFCHVDNVVQANILAALVQSPQAVNRVYNVGLGHATSLNELFGCLREKLVARVSQLKQVDPQYRAFRPGDVRHSLADISRISHSLAYAPEVDLQTGLAIAMDWYARPNA